MRYKGRESGNYFRFFVTGPALNTMLSLVELIPSTLICLSTTPPMYD